MKQLIFMLISSILISACQSPQTSLTEIVTTKNGKIEGYSLPAENMHVFKGIPFAEPPVGKLRWKAPQPVKDWDGIKQCEDFSAIAMQGDPKPFWMWTSEFIAPAGNMNEDCLYLNIWTPAKTTQDKLPVMVYIHGGGFSSGSGSVPLYDGTNMAQKGVVFVTINYRVGMFGFFSHPELTAQSPNHASGNQGLLDQVAALQWVNKNIMAFGGDPNNVTIAGQSAGAFSVCYLMASPLCKGLVHRVIAESGGATFPEGRLSGSTTLTDAEKIGTNLQKKAGVNSLSALQSIDAKTLMKNNIPTSPIVDGYFLNKSVYETFKAGEQNDVPLITGWNGNEGLNYQQQRKDQFISSIKEKYGNKANEFFDVFPANKEEEALQSQNTLADLTTFGIQTYNWMLMQNKTGTSNVYVYHFTRDVPYGENQQDFGAFHSGEIAYAYDNLDKSSVRPWTDADYKLADKMSSYWVNFAKSGNPNGESLPDWNSCKSEKDKVMNFDKELKCIDFPYLKELRFLRKSILSNNE